MTPTNVDTGNNPTPMELGQVQYEFRDVALIVGNGAIKVLTVQEGSLP